MKREKRNRRATAALKSFQLDRLLMAHRTDGYWWISDSGPL
jgi:hypothetical protein